VGLLPNRDLLPYRRAIEAGVPIVHVGNTLVPTIDKENRPASLSPRVMKDVLRGGLEFEGVILAGPVDTNEIVVRYHLTEATILALRAGADMILWNGTGTRVAKTVDEVSLAIQNGRLDQEVVDAALKRILTLKQEMELQTWPYPVPKDAAKLSQEKDYLEQAYEIERRSLTIVQNHNEVLPLNHERSVPVAITGIIGVEELHEALEEYIKPVSQQRITTARHLGKIHDFEIERLTKHNLGLRTVIVTLTSEVDADSQRALIGAFRKKGIRVVVVYLGYPDISAIRGANTIILSFSNPAAYEETMRAVADVLVGQAPLGIAPEFTELKTRVGQSDVYNALDVIRAPSGRLPIDLEPPFLAGLSVHYDPSFTIKKVEWNFGDGKKSKEIITRKAYKKPGRYPASLTVTDKKKRVSHRDFFVTVE
jgi:beta-N-acetylhexosaminidase